MKQTKTKTVLGHWDTYSGAEEGSLICHTAGDHPLILNPDGSISEMKTKDQVDWTPKEI